MKMNKSSEGMTVAKVDTSNKLVFGWGTVCQKNGDPYYDTDNQHFPEDVAIKGWVEFMKNARVSKAMHEGEQVGDVVFAFPATDDIIKSLGMTLGDQSGIIVGVVINDEATLNKFYTGVYKGFSIGGSATFEDV